MLLVEETRWTQHGKPQPKAESTTDVTQTMNHVVGAIREILEGGNRLYRNLGGWRFKDITDQAGVRCPRQYSTGAVLADVDGDGDLDDGDSDVITNDLNGEAGLYQNEGIRPRVAVRLKGAGANTRGIGSKISLHDGAVPVQSQEMICGGRYLSCDDAMRVFAAGTETNRMRIEVRWRSGKRSVVEGVRANREYEIDEVGATAMWKGVPKSSRPESTSGDGTCGE